MGTAGSYTLTFTKAGDYTYYCLLHQPVMQAVLHVHPAGTTYPHNQFFYTHAGEEDEWGILNEAAQSITEFPFTPRGTHIGAGIAHGLFSASAAEGTVVRFIDTNRPSDTPLGAVSIHKGTTITWTNLSNNEPHTVTIPLPGQKPPDSLSPFNPPIGGHVYDGTHLIHSGPLFPGQSFSVTFTKAGGFYYFCLFHDEEGMSSSVHVDP